MADDGLVNNTIQVMKDAKNTASERAGQYLGQASDATGGLVKFKTSISGTSGSTTGSGSSGSTSKDTGVRPVACSNIDSDGLRVMILAASGIPCDDISNYGPLLPDYKISEQGESGVIPRTLTLRKLASDLVVKYESWVNDVMGAKEADMINTDGYKAIYNRTNIAITIQQHRKINLLMNTNPAQGLAMIRNLSQLIGLKDLTLIVNNLEVAVLTGIQNQPDDQLLSDFRKKQYVHAIETLKTELANLTSEITLDLKRNEIMKTN